MGSNLYGGISYPDNSFVFDKIYTSESEALKGAKTDGVLLGRYILVSYCPGAVLDYDTQLKLFKAEEVSSVSEDELTWFENCKKDRDNCSECAYRKVYKNSELTYEKIARLTTSQSQEAIETSAREYMDDVLGTYNETAFSSTNTIGKTIEKVKENADSQIESVNSKISTINSTLNTIQGSDTTKSMREIADEVVASVVDDAPEKFDTLKEIAAWIDDPETQGGAMEMQQDISTLKTNVSELKAEDKSLDTKITTNKNDISTLNSTATSLDTRITSLENSIDKQIVEVSALPITGASASIIYSVPASGSTRNLYILNEITASGYTWSLIGTTATSRATVYESDIAQNAESKITTGDSLMSTSYNFPQMQYNRFAAVAEDEVQVELSTDNGQTWGDYSTSLPKRNLFLTGRAASAFQLSGGGYVTNTNKYLSNQLRITINSNNATCYCLLKKIIVFISTGGHTGCQCKVEQKINNDEGYFWNELIPFTTITGWPAWSEVNIAQYKTWGSKANNVVSAYRFTFKATGTIDLSESSVYKGLTIFEIAAFGSTLYASNSPLVSTGLPFYTDANNNINLISGSTIIGDLVGTASKATADSSGNNIINTYATKTEVEEALPKWATY